MHDVLSKATDREIRERRGEFESTIEGRSGHGNMNKEVSEN